MSPGLTHVLPLFNLPNFPQGRTEQHCYKCVKRKGFEVMTFTFLLIKTKTRKAWGERGESMLCLGGFKNAEKKHKAFQHSMLHLKSAEYMPRIQFEMKNQRRFVIHFHYMLPNPPQTLFPSEISAEQGMGYFCADRNSIPTKPHFPIQLYFTFVFLEQN